MDNAQQRLNLSLTRAHQQLDENVQMLIRAIDEQRKSAAKEIEAAYSAKQVRKLIYASFENSKKNPNNRV